MNKEGIIVKNIGDNYTVFSENENIVCKARGKFKNLKITPIVGDKVIFDYDLKMIEKINKRKNSLYRPLISNLDEIIVVTSLKKPEFSAELLDKFLTIISYNNITASICFTKLDLCSKKELEEFEIIFNYYKKIGYDVYFNNEIEELIKTFKNRVVALTGQTGAGKSSLLNKIDPNLNLKTDKISSALNRGKHTTRCTELLKVKEGLIADTPGFSLLEFVGMTKEDIRDNFKEFYSYSNDCKYRGCYHLNEPKCKVIEKVKEGEILKSRYTNYKKFMKEK